MRPIHYSALLLAGTSLLAFPYAASAQDGFGDMSIDEIVTTGIRQAYQGDFTALEIPQANQTIDNDLLVDVGALDLNDALDLSASVSRQNNFGGLWNSFAIRGFSGDINLPSGFLVNGFNAGRGFGGPRDLVGVEAVEILKGPRSALFGRGEPGGTVNLITKRPDFETGGYVQGTIGSWDQYRFEADVQSTLGENDRVGVRLVGFYEDAESFREGVETEKRGFYPSITLAPTDSITVTYELEYTEQELPQDRGVVFAENFGFSPRRVFVGEPVPIETEVIGHQIEAEVDLDDNWSLLTGVGFRETSLEGDSFEPQFGSRQTFRLDGQTVSRFFRTRDFESDYLTLRAEIAGEFDTGGLRHRLIFGADYDAFDNTLFIERYRTRFTGDITNPTPQEIATDLLLDVTNPVYGVNLNPVPGPNTNRNEVLSGFGVYIQDQIDITDRFQIRLGGRFDDFEQDLTQLGGVAPTTRTLSDSRFSPQVGAVYLVNEGLSLYASYGEGFRQQGGVDFLGNQFDPNLTEAIEAGIKADLGRYFDGIAGSATLAVFEIDQSNILVNDDRPANTGFSSFAAGAARSRGVEFDANAEFAEDLRLWFSYAYTDAEFRNTFQDADGFGFTINPGDPLINAPEHQLNVQLIKEWDIGEMEFELGGGLLYVDDQNGFVGSDFTLPDYTTVRIFAEVEPVENVELRLDVDNLFDETFYTNSFADVWVQPGAPRRFRFTARYEF
ncbi:MAG: TonB-dependent siderophore receptor [Pseudomonadota bacterium]